MSGTIELQSPPSTLSLYFRAVTGNKSGRAPEGMGELARCTLNGVRTRMSDLATYREVCGFPTSGSLPVTYPFVLAFPLHMELLVSDAFPFALLGLVHVKNDITQYRAIGNQEVMDIECVLSGPRQASKGLEFDIITRVHVQGKLVWECTSAMLRRMKSAQSDGKKDGERKQDSFVPQHVVSWPVQESTGRRYAAVAGDRNPIHIHALTAKLFGFPRAIAHGMWSKAHALAEMDALMPRGPFRVSVAFKLPVFLPSNVQLQYSDAGGRIEFHLKDANGEKPHLSGSVEAL